MKKHIVLVVGYNGIGYSGVQYSKDVKTIEGVIMDVLYELKCIKDSNYLIPQKIGLKSISRTDKGVHALYNLFQLKIEQDPLVDNALFKNIKSELFKNNILLYKILRTTKSFLGFKSVSTRTYNYYLPSYFLDPTKEVSNLYTADNILKSLSGFRISQTHIDQFNQVLLKYKGTKSYHNFTHSKMVKDPLRVINDIQIKEKLIYNDVEYAKIVINGNSFIIHQIRKMISFAIMSFKNSSNEIIERNFNEIFVPENNFITSKVPGEYLLLESIDFFLKKFKDSNHCFVSPDVNLNEKINFKEKIILPEIFNTENLKAWAYFFESFSKYKETSFRYFFE